MIEVCNPVTYVEEKMAVRAPLVFKGKRVGLLNNSKPNVDLLFDHMAKQFPKQHQTGPIVRIMKPNAAQPASSDIIRKLSEEVEVVINAVGD